MYDVTGAYTYHLDVYGISLIVCAMRESTQNPFHFIHVKWKKIINVWSLVFIICSKVNGFRDRKLRFAENKSKTNLIILIDFAIGAPAVTTLTQSDHQENDKK